MPAIQNEILNLKAQCQIVWFPWITEFPGNSESPDYAALSDSYVFDISAHLISCTFSKNRGAPAGSFAFRLDNSRDWKKIMRPGQWCTIFMSNAGDLLLPSQSSGGVDFNGLPAIDSKTIKKNRLRGICYIERVSVNVETSAEGALEVFYEVSGRDFGVIYEETSIWYNYFQYEQLQVTKLAEKTKFSNLNTVRELLDVTHDLFYAPGKVISGQTDATQLFSAVGVQWLLPRNMLSLLGIKLKGDYSFFGNIEGLKKLSPTISTVAVTDPLSYINGNSWEKLREFSVKELHELFVELDDLGNPSLVFRPIPWAIDSRGYPKIAAQLGSALFYKNLTNTSGISLRAVEVLSSNIGEDNHARYNHFLTTTRATFGLPEANISLLKGRKSSRGREYPFIQKGSIRRHGFRPMHVDVDTLGQFSGNPTLKVDRDLLLEANELIYDYWNNAVFFESGTFKIIGKNEVRVGKVLNLDEKIPYHGNKIFYIEEYIDEFQIDEQGVGSWEQTITVSRGIDKASLEAKSGFASKAEEFTQIATFVKG